jgi:hypothetical protein
VQLLVIESASLALLPDDHAWVEEQRPHWLVKVHSVPRVSPQRTHACMVLAGLRACGAEHRDLAGLPSSRLCLGLRRPLHEFMPVRNNVAIDRRYPRFLSVKWFIYLSALRLSDDAGLCKRPRCGCGMACGSL